MANRIKKAAGDAPVSTWVAELIEEHLDDAKLERLWAEFYESVRPSRTTCVLPKTHAGATHEAVGRADAAGVKSGRGVIHGCRHLHRARATRNDIMVRLAWPLRGRADPVDHIGRRRRAGVARRRRASGSGGLASPSYDGRRPDCRCRSAARPHAWRHGFVRPCRCSRRPHRPRARVAGAHVRSR